jgi:cell wall-associated NlpC family hydrolase
LPVNGVALGAVAAGGVLVWAGIKGYSVPATVQSLITGKSPAGQPVTAPVPVAAEIAAAAAAASGSVTLGNPPVTGAGASGAAADAQRYIGQGYTFGGPSSPGKWDCSSFANYVYGHDLGLMIPGGTWAKVTANGTQHGPATGSWITFGTGVPAASAQPGDAVVWLTHMGIYIGGGQMVSALNHSLGTRQTTVAGGAPGGEGPGSYRRIT